MNEQETQLLTELNEKLKGLDKRNSFELSRSAKGVPTWTIKVYAESWIVAADQTKLADDFAFNAFKVRPIEGAPLGKEI